MPGGTAKLTPSTAGLSSGPAEPLDQVDGLDRGGHVRNRNGADRHRAIGFVSAVSSACLRVQQSAGVPEVDAEWFVAPEYWLARQILQRGVAVIYLIAFIAAARQFRALIGEHGMLPVPRFVARVSFRTAPSIFHLHYSDRFFAVVCWFGAALSAAIVAGVIDLVPLWAAMVMWLVLWVLYLSIVNVGQRWYGFGWESLLLEAGFHRDLPRQRRDGAAAAGAACWCAGCCSGWSSGGADQAARRSRAGAISPAWTTTTRRSRCRGR